MVYLAQVADDLSRQLEERGRLRWFEEECAKLGTPAYYKELLRIPDELFPKLKKVKSLSGPERSAPQPSVHPRQLLSQSSYLFSVSSAAHGICSRLIFPLLTFSFLSGWLQGKRVPPGVVARGRSCSEGQAAVLLAKGPGPRRDRQAHAGLSAAAA